LNEYIIIDRKVIDDHRSKAENPMTHALSGQWPFGWSKQDLKQSSLRQARSTYLTIVTWIAELAAAGTSFNGVEHDNMLVTVIPRHLPKSEFFKFF
jgi:hypothetical protein